MYVVPDPLGIMEETLSTNMTVSPSGYTKNQKPAYSEVP